MAKSSSFGPLVLVMAALSCSFYVACGDDDVVFGTGGSGGGGGTGGGSSGSAGDAGAEAGTGGQGGTAGTAGTGGTAGGGGSAGSEIPDGGGPESTVDGGDSGPTSNG